MYVKVRRTFTLGTQIHDRGDVLLVMAEIQDELPNLLRDGLVVVIERPADPVQLQAPEDGQQLTFR